jgi:hypothetical protein
MPKPFDSFLVSLVVITLTIGVAATSAMAEPQDADDLAESSPSPSSSSARTLTLSPKLGSVFPIFFGGGAEITVKNHYQIDLEGGFTPKPYASAIGSAAASLGGNAAYKDVAEAAFQNNSLVRLGARYCFRDPATGWRVGLFASRLTSSGKAAIDQVLAAATGNTYTNLKTLLTAAGRSTDVDMTATLTIGEFEGSYGWTLGRGFFGNASFGVAKVLDSTVALKTGLTNFEASAAGSSLLRTTESDLRSILIQYGLSPTVGFTVGYAL